MEMLTIMAPLALLFMMLEMVAAKAHGAKVYSSWQATASSLTSGIGTLFIGLYLNIFLFYGFIQSNFSLLELSAHHWYTWAIAIAALDFTFYSAHRLCHKIPFLWAMHVVHHQSNDYNFSVGVRTPWLQPLMFAPFIAMLAFVGVPIEVMAPVYLGQQIYKLLTHTRLLGNLGVFGKIFVTPNHHAAHHAYNQGYLNKNFGGVLIIWDRLFGTFAELTEKPRYGVSEKAEHNPLRNNLDPWRNLAQRAKAAPSLNAAFGTLLRASTDS